LNSSHQTDAATHYRMIPTEYAAADPIDSSKVLDCAAPATVMTWIGKNCVTIIIVADIVLMATEFVSPSEAFALATGSPLVAASVSPGRTLYRRGGERCIHRSCSSSAIAIAPS